jgi:hypothetical protein
MATKPFDGVKMGKTKEREYKIGNKKLSKKLKNIKMFEEFSAINEATVAFEDFLVKMDSIPEAQLKDIMGDEYIDTPGNFAEESAEAEEKGEGLSSVEDVKEWFSSNMGRETLNDLEEWFEANPPKVAKIMKTK